ncbi:MAG TPA: serine/threonine-protein kinase [Kofleriaceae bacterium]|nr:serine/threonine-protein kinase [Kofleriaceae bacterium]
MIGDGADDPTLKPDGATVPATEPEVEPPRRRSLRPSIGSYEIGEVIGEGGMGEVLLARDPVIERNVAIKRMRTADPTADALRRFLREAKIQARLDHPAIVPVHELGYDAEGRPYFTMKRLTGTTLQALLLDRNATTQRMLRAFTDVCLAIELAHEKGVVHRDLKPANIMLGDYGEVYVLDWGVARVVGTEEQSESGATIETAEGSTQAGAILGTPGYMAPEQLRGETVTGSADVYALGSILFEILAREPLHPRGGGAMSSTLDESTPRSPAQRAPQSKIAPELDAACVAALAHDPASRPSARELGDRVQRYLDGDRDLERRRELAAKHLGIAEASFAANDRAAAMAEAGRALALDPESPAAALITRLMLEPPKEQPAGLRRAIESDEARFVERHARTTMLSYLAIFLLVPIVVWNGVVKWQLIIAILATAVVLVLSAWQIWRRPVRTNREMVLYMLANAMLVSLASRLSGPLILTPALACMVIMSAISYPLFTRRPFLLLAIAGFGWVLPIAVEAAGLLAPTWRVVDGAVISTSASIHIGGIPTIVFLFGVSVAVIVIATLHAGTMARTNRSARDQLVSQAWHLRQLLPGTSA